MKLLLMSDSESLIRFLIKEGALFREGNSQVGGNSKFLQFNYGGSELVLKIYRGDVRRIRDSRQREFSAYLFLRENGFLCLPELHETLEADDSICLEFISGTTPGCNKQTNQEILKSFLLLKEMYARNRKFENAVDAALSTSDVLNQIRVRINLFDLSLKKEKELIVAVMRVLEARHSINFPKHSLTYSFSDIGPHNMIMKDEKYYFLDLEYFGKDSAVKMILDYLLHPRNQFSFEDKVIALEWAEKELGISLDLVINCAPFFAAKWATIIARRMTLEYRQQSLSDLKIDFERCLEIAILKDVSEIQDKLLNSR
jgi:tRNA A-37 threonylcarbamoyl transferase component Bud32